MVWNGMGIAWAILLVILMVVFWGGIIALIVWAVVRFTGHRNTSIDYKNDPLNIAKERYAKGEITKEQFEQIKKDLQD